MYLLSLLLDAANATGSDVGSATFKYYIPTGNSIAAAGLGYGAASIRLQCVHHRQEHGTNLHLLDHLVLYLMLLSGALITGVKML
jgi:hypothetical protein